MLFTESDTPGAADAAGVERSVRRGGRELKDRKPEIGTRDAHGSNICNLETVSRAKESLVKKEA